MNKKAVAAIIVVVIALIAGIAALGGRGGGQGAPASPELAAFAQCVASKNVTMYGAYWCSHCQNEKRKFGDAFKYIPYVECTQEVQKCVELGVQGYPTWITADGTKYSGEQGIEGVARISGCPAPGSQTQ